MCSKFHNNYDYILTHFSLISQESQYAQAIKMVIESQAMTGGADEMYWYETCSLISDCQREDISQKLHMQKSCNTCVDTLNMLKDVFLKRPAEVSTNGYVMGMLEARYALVASHLTDYTETSDNNLSSASPWSVSNIRCSQKIHRHLEMPKIDSIRSCLPWGISTYLRVVHFEGS